MTAPLLLTPGPLTTDARVRAAMDRDWGSRDHNFIALTAELRARLLDVANGAGSHVAVPIQGAGTYVLEAAADTLIARGERLLVLVNGAYGRRMAGIARRLGHDVTTLDWPEHAPVDPAAVARALARDAAIGWVAIAQCETTTGLLNPLAEVAAVVAGAGRRLIVDAMSGFGALPIDLATLPAAAILASGNKCLEGAPGVAFALLERAVLAAAGGRARSTSLDLHAQWQGFEDNGQWRFTPPVQVVAALVAALRLLAAEGGPPARLARYTANLDALVAGAAACGLDLYLDRAVQAPIIATFRTPPGLGFAAFHDALAGAGFVIYPGKLTQADTFRIGCIGAVTPADMQRLGAALPAALSAARGD